MPITQGPSEGKLCGSSPVETFLQTSWPVEIIGAEKNHTIVVAVEKCALFHTKQVDATP